MPPKSPVRALPAAPPLISILTSAESLPEQDNRWEAGVAYEAEQCGSGVGAFAACEASGVSSAPGSTIITIEPIIVWAGDSCSPNGFAARDWQGRARRKLASCEANQIENELWRGTIAREQLNGPMPSWPNRFFAESTTPIVTSAPTLPIPALACLEQALAACNCGAQGMIHATPEVVTHWIAESLVTRDGNKLYTQLGTIVVPGSGYDGSGPASIPDGDPTPPSDGSVWAYASSMVHYRMGPVATLPSDPSQAMDRTTNTITYWAQRVVVAGFDCCVFAAEVDVPACENAS